MIYSIFDAIYDTYSSALFAPPSGRRAAWELRRLDRLEQAKPVHRQSGSGSPASPRRGDRRRGAVGA